MGGRTLLISIHPQHAARIFDGTKTVELRRTRPRLAAGDFVLVYQSTPTRALCGAFEVQRLIAAAPERLWPKVKRRAGISAELFASYFDGAAIGYGICIHRAWRFTEARSLSELRKSLPGFHPPQVYRYLTEGEVKALRVDFDGERRAA